jgi:hypothetical protein
MRREARKATSHQASKSRVIWRKVHSTTLDYARAWVVVEHVVVDRLSYRILYTYLNVGFGERIRRSNSLRVLLRMAPTKRHTRANHQKQSGSFKVFVVELQFGGIQTSYFSHISPSDVSC